MMGVRSKSCESCKTSPATIFCKTDSAFLCLVCDSKIHVVSRHPRVWLCDVCENSPAAFTCKADAASLCVSCDRDIHSANPLALRHHRAPVIPFGGVDDDDHCSEEAEAASWLLPNPPDDDDQKKPPISPSNSNSNNYSCCDGVVPSNYPPPPLQVDGFPAYNLDSTPFFYNFNSITQTPVSSSSLDVALVPDHNDANSESQLPNPVSGIDREARVLRYREKRKNRKFQKTIRYASRKAYAETRPRIKGRFAKRSEIVHASTYGVVPSY